MDLISLSLGIFIGLIIGGVVVMLIMRSSARALAQRNDELTQQTMLQFEQLSQRISREQSEDFQRQSASQIATLIAPLNQTISAFKEHNELQQKHNEAKIHSLLDPLSRSIATFKERVENNLVEQTKQNSSLESLIKNLVDTTSKVGAEANNLASALKGDVKKMGNWGEVILESILEGSGLLKGREYDTQATLKDEDSGKVLRPDVVVNLPENRKIIIDSKVSLIAYDRYAAAQTPEEQKLAVSEHLRSIKCHIDELSAKEYDTLLGASLDFTMMFIPVEPAYMVAINNDSELWNYAYKKRIILISPTNLVACLKLIADLWKREMQSKNAQKIVERAELLYSKLSTFVVTMQKVGGSLDSAKDHYDKALGQLSQGRGNLISQAEKLREMGLKSQSKIPESLINE
ncbi:MAG: DNA recombination protein RmuC [Rikenellaceae bacterium]